jgi:hypothetical protein
LAAAWFIDREIEVFVPLLHTPRDFDFIVDWGEGPKRVQGIDRGLSLAISGTSLDSPGPWRDTRAVKGTRL